MTVKIKICGITSVGDGLMAAAAGADMIGLVFYEPSKRYVTVKAAREIARALPASVLRVGVFVDPEESLMREAIGACGLNWLQFHGNEAPEFCTRFGVMSIKALRVKNAESLRTLENYQTDAFLLDAHAAAGLGGTGERFDWELAAAARKFGKPIFLAGGLTPLNVGKAVRQVRPFAVDVSSGVESAPGIKDRAKVEAFIAAARSGLG
jgi:phosphoribosylanthranilate isomerase